VLRALSKHEAPEDHDAAAWLALQVHVHHHVLRCATSPGQLARKGVVAHVACATPALVARRSEFLPTLHTELRSVLSAQPAVRLRAEQKQTRALQSGLQTLDSGAYLP
jgi:hypothetical protein